MIELKTSFWNEVFDYNNSFRVLSNLVQIPILGSGYDQIQLNKWFTIIAPLSKLNIECFEAELDYHKRLFKDTLKKLQKNNTVYFNSVIEPHIIERPSGGGYWIQGLCYYNVYKRRSKNDRFTI